jgi:hypothetical protein
MLPEISFASIFASSNGAPSNAAPSKWKQRLRRALTTAPARGTKSSIWYAGLAAEPAEFSRQLADLDLSILRENQRCQSLQPTGKAQADSR